MTKYLIGLLLIIIIVLLCSTKTKSVDNDKETKDIYEEREYRLNSILASDTLIYDQYLEEGKFQRPTEEDKATTQDFNYAVDVLYLSDKPVKCDMDYTDFEFEYYVLQQFIAIVINSYPEDIALDYLKVLLHDPYKFYGHLIMKYTNNKLFICIVGRDKSEYKRIKETYNLSLSKHSKVVENLMKEINARDGIEVPRRFLPGYCPLLYNNNYTWFVKIWFNFLTEWLTRHDITINTMTLDDVRQWLEISPKELLREKRLNRKNIQR